MFNFGILCLILGSIFVYGTIPIAKTFSSASPKSILLIKVTGLVLAIVGGVLIFLGEYPQKLQFLKIINI